MNNQKDFIAELIKDNEVIDTTSINENNMKLAEDLFYNEFGHIRTDDSFIEIYEAETMEVENNLNNSINDLLKNNSIFKIAELITDKMGAGIKNKNVLSDPRAVIDFAKLKIGSLHYENFLIIFTNVKNEIIDYEIVAEGTIDQAIIYPRRIIEKTLFHDAAGIILLHNHPSDSCYPSKPDQIITLKIKEVLNHIDAKLLDHIIVGKTDHYSFQEEGEL